MTLRDGTQKPTAEMLALDAIPELQGTPFPFHGKRDFRGFTQDDYENFAGGVFAKIDEPGDMKWFGGRLKFESAKAKLLELGYDLTYRHPGDADATSDTWHYIYLHVKESA